MYKKQLILNDKKMEKAEVTLEKKYKRFKVYYRNGVVNEEVIVGGGLTISQALKHFVNCSAVIGID